MDESDDTFTDEDFEIIKRIAGVYESLPPESVALILAQKEDLTLNPEFDGLDMNDQVLVSVIDNLPKEFENKLVFYLTHGLLEMIEDNFEDLIETGKNWIEYLKKQKNKSSATIVQLSDYRNKFK